MAKISVAQAYSYAAAAGFSGNAQTIIVAIAQAESGLDPNATNCNNPGGSCDRGIVQINNYWHKEVSDACAYDPACAFQAAYTISQSGTNFNPWTTYTSGAYQKYIGAGSITGGSAGTATIGDVFHNKNLWLWWEQNNGIGTNPFNGVTEKGIDYSNAFGTPIGVPVGGKILRIVHNNNSIGDVVELQAADGSVWLYQHINTAVKVGQTLGVGGVIGTENGLPVDQYSTGPHIEVRYCRPGTWSAATDSWNEPWVNPYSIFSGLSNQLAGSIASSSFLNINTQAITNLLAPNANVTQTLYALDQFGALTNPFNSSAITPWGWAGDVGNNLFGDMRAIVFRFMLLVIGAFLIYKALSEWVDVGAVAGAAARLGESAALMV